MTHTPGPWSLIGVTCKGNADKRSVTSPSRRILDISLDDDEQAANARLIVAAPKLLYALERMLSDKGSLKARALAEAEARAAIALAKGENK